MKKLTLLIAFITLNLISVTAQDTIPNKGFDSWTSSGKQPPFDWVEPSLWTSSNSITEFVSAGVTKTQYSGSTSWQAKLKTLNIFGQAVPAILINGDFPISLSDTANFPLVGGTPYTKVEQKLYGLYNFSAIDTTDSASVVVMFKKFNSTTQKTEAVAGGRVRLPNSTVGLHPFVLNITPFNSQMPDSVVISIFSSNENNFKNGGELIVDFVSFTLPVSVKTTPTGNYSVYPSPAQNEINITSTGENFTYSVIDIAGKVLLTGTAAANGKTTADISALPTGCYIIRMEGDTNGVLKFIKE